MSEGGTLRRAVLPALAVLFVLHALHLQCVAEDAYISFRFARNLASGHGLVWNVGEAPVEGYTNFLWVALCALAFRAGLDLPVFSQVLGIVSGLVTLPVVYALALGPLALDALSAVLACLFLAIAGPFATWASGGMETSLFTLLVSAGLYFYCTSRRLPAYASLTLATLTRPEGFLFFAILAFRELATPRGSGSLRRVRDALLAYVLPCAAYFLWRWWYFGWLLPNTFYAKTGGGTVQALRGAWYAAYFSLHFLLPLGFLLVPLLWRSDPGPRDAARGRRDALVTLALALLAYAAYVVWVGGDYMAMYRFFVPVLPIVYLLCAAAFAAGLRAARTPRRRLALVALAACSAGLTIVQSTPLERRIFPKPPLQHGTWGGVAIERWHVARLHLLARFFEETRRGSGHSIATQPIGIIGYETSMKVYGFHGLVDPVIAHGTRLARPVGAGLPGHEKQDPARALSFRPTFFMFSRALTRSPLGYPSYDPATDAVLHRDYTLSSAWLDDAANGESGFFTYLERRADVSGSF